MDPGPEMPVIESGKLLKRPEVMIHDAVRSLEKSRNFRAYITNRAVTNAVQARMKKLRGKGFTPEELEDAYRQAECDGLVYRVSGLRNLETNYWFSQEHAAAHGFGDYKVVIFDDPRYVSTVLRNLIYDTLANGPQRHASDLFRHITKEKKRFLNYSKEYFSKHCVINPPIKNPFREWIQNQVSGRYYAKIVELPQSASPPPHPSRTPSGSGQPPFKKRKHSTKSSRRQSWSMRVQNNNNNNNNHDEEDEVLAAGRSFRSYRQPSNAHRKTRDEHIAGFSWELKVPHYIKDDFVSYLNDELQFQLGKPEDRNMISRMFKLPSTVETWDHHHTRLYLAAIGYPELADNLFHYEFSGIDLLLLTREEILNSFHLPLGRAMKMASFFKRLHDVRPAAT